jgi:hypothetical protein
MNDNTRDLNPEWLNVVRRLQGLGAKQGGFAIITLQVVVDGNGNPIFWDSPTLKKLEPARLPADFWRQVVAGFKV